MSGQRNAPAALPPGKTRHILYRRLGGSQGQSGRVRKISAPPGFDPRTVQPVASRNTDCAVPVSTTAIYRVIHKSLRDFRTRLRNNQDRHGRKEHINR